MSNSSISSVWRLVVITQHSLYLFILLAMLLFELCTSGWLWLALGGPRLASSA